MTRVTLFAALASTPALAHGFAAPARPVVSLLTLVTAVAVGGWAAQRQAPFAVCAAAVLGLAIGALEPWPQLVPAALAVLGVLIGAGRGPLILTALGFGAACGVQGPVERPLLVLVALIGGHALMLLWRERNEAPGDATPSAITARRVPTHGPPRGRPAGRALPGRTGRALRVGADQALPPEDV